MSLPEPQPPPVRHHEVRVVGWARISRTRYEDWEVYLKNGRSDTMLMIACGMPREVAEEMQREINSLLAQFHKRPLLNGHKPPPNAEAAATALLNELAKSEEENVERSQITSDEQAQVSCQGGVEACPRS